MKYLINRNKDINGKNEVHTHDCSFKPNPENQINLGNFTDELFAIMYARNIGWKDADGCHYCCPRAHKH